MISLYTPRSPPRREGSGVGLSKNETQCPYTPGSVPEKIRCLSFIYAASHPAAPAFYPPSQNHFTRADNPPIDGLHELAASSRHSPTITRRLVVSYTTFSPLPQSLAAVILFCRNPQSPTASIFGSGASYAARTFLSQSLAINSIMKQLLTQKTAIFCQRQAGTLHFRRQRYNFLTIQAHFRVLKKEKKAFSLCILPTSSYLCSRFSNKFYE